MTSTSLAAQRESEGRWEIVAGYHRAVVQAIEGYGGHVGQYRGDGVMAYFGWPQAHDNDAECAVRASLAILEAVSELNHDATTHPLLSPRVGIDSGAVMVRASAGKVADLFGEPPDIAARVAAAADSGTVLITAETHRLVSGLFVVEERGAQVVKDLERAVQLYRVIRLSGVRGRFEAAAAAGGLTPFVGRWDEMRSLISCWGRALDGESQVALIIGEPGIGKSRLLQRFHEQIADTPHTWIEAGAGAFFQNTPFYPVTEMLHQFLGGASAQGQIAELESRLMRVGLKPRVAIPLLGPLLNLRLPAEYPASLATPEQQRCRLLGMLVEWVLGSARAQPLVIVTEDLHWIDPSTLELIQLLVEQCMTTRLLLLYTGRPEFRAPWPQRTHHTQIMINRLSAGHARTMVDAVTGQRELSEETIATVIGRAGGVPLFVEELTRAVIESGDAKLAASEIPATLHDSLMARLDRLGPARHVAQAGAVIGSEFSYELLHALYPIAEEEFQRALHSLADAELLYVRGIPPAAIYKFKHALIRDAAYEALPISRRKEMHRAVSRALIGEFAQQSEAEPALLAYHLTEAGERDGAVAAWRRAGDHAAARGALLEAENHYSRAIEVLLTTPVSDDRNEREMGLQISLGSVLSPTKGLASREVESAFLRARELGDRLGHVESAAILGLWQTCLTRGKLAAAQSLAEQWLKIAQCEGGALSLCRGHLALGATFLLRGMLAESLVHLRTSVERSHERDAVERPFDAGVLAMSYFAVALMLAGFPDQAREVSARSLRTVKDLGKPSSIVICAVNVAAMHQLSFNPRAVLEVADYAADVGRSHGVAQLVSAFDVYGGWAVAACGNPRDGAEQIRRGLTEWLANGQRMPHAWFLSMLAWAYGLDQRFEDAEVTLRDADAAVNELQMEEPIVAWTRADILRMAGANGARVEAAWRAAVDSARSKGMRLFELRSTVGLARLFTQQGRRDEARAMLVDIHGWFSEGFDTADLKAAEALLGQLP